MKSVLTQPDRALMPPLDSASACPAHLLLQAGREDPRAPGPFFILPLPPSRQRPGNKSNRPHLCTRHCAVSFDILANLCRGCYGNTHY